MQTQLNPPVTSLANPPTVVEPGAITAAGAVRTHPSLSETDTSEAEKSEFLWNSHNYINEYIRYGDTKAAFVAATASALLGILYSSKIYVPIIQLPCSQWTSAEWFAIIAATLLASSVILSLLTIRPRLKSTQSQGFIFWGSIAAHEKLERLQTSFDAQSIKTLNDHLLHHLFDLSVKVVVPKYKQISLLILAAGIGGFAAALALILNDLNHLAISN